MEIKVNIDEKNKKRVLELISQLVEAESQSKLHASDNQKINSTEEKNSFTTFGSDVDFLAPFSALNIPHGTPRFEKSVAGSWGMFNSFLPGKASLRVLSRMVTENNGPVSFEKFMRTCVKAFKMRGLSTHRGFPKQKESSVSRTEWHLIRPFAHLGLMEIIESEKGQLVLITKKGLEFANLKNPVLDGEDGSATLSKDEQKWLIMYLKSIESEGFQEYSMLNEFLAFLKRGHHEYQDLLEWFSTNKRMLDYLKTWSRKKDDPDAFRAQIENVAAVFVTGKVALLRELGLVSSKRNDYTVLGEI